MIIKKNHWLASALLTSAAFFCTDSASAINCTLILPNDPLTAEGLSTPYQLTGTDPGQPCNEINPDHSAFVQAAIIDPDTGEISLYTPLVIDKGTSPALPPVVPMLPRNAVVAIWFGFNGDTLRLRAHNDDLRDNHCVNGLNSNSLFGQFAYCNAVKFFQVANDSIRSGRLHIPDPGIGYDGEPCPTTRDFGFIDQDPSDNLPVSYITLNGQVAQNNRANRQALRGATKLSNPSDEGLVPLFVDPALGCKRFTKPDLSDPGKRSSALALNELQASVFQRRPIALVGLEDPMALDNGNESLTKLNAYRRGVGQPEARTVGDADPVAYCRHFRSIQQWKLQTDRGLFSNRPSPAPDVANSLFTFLAQRYVSSYDQLKCQALLNKPVNIKIVTDNKGVATDAIFYP